MSKVLNHIFKLYKQARVDKKAEDKEFYKEYVEEVKDRLDKDNRIDSYVFSDDNRKVNIRIKDSKMGYKKTGFISLVQALDIEYLMDKVNADGKEMDAEKKVVRSSKAKKLSKKAETIEQQINDKKYSIDTENYDANKLLEIIDDIVYDYDVIKQALDMTKNQKEDEFSIVTLSPEKDKVLGVKYIKKDDVYDYKPNQNEYALVMTRDTGFADTDYQLQPMSMVVRSWNEGRKFYATKKNQLNKKAEEDLIEVGWGLENSDEDMIKSLAEDMEIKVDENFWKRINKDIDKVESWFLKEGYKKFFTKVRDEGHGKYNELGGTAWMTKQQLEDYISQAEKYDENSYMLLENTGSLYIDINHDDALEFNLFIYVDDKDLDELGIESKRVSKNKKFSSKAKAMRKRADLKSNIEEFDKAWEKHEENFFKDYEQTLLTEYKGNLTKATQDLINSFERKLPKETLYKLLKEYIDRPSFEKIEEKDLQEAQQLVENFNKTNNEYEKNKKTIEQKIEQRLRNFYEMGYRDYKYDKDSIKEEDTYWNNLTEEEKQAYYEGVEAAKSETSQHKYNAFYWKTQSSKNTKLTKKADEDLNKEYKLLENGLSTFKFNKKIIDFLDSINKKFDKFCVKIYGKIVCFNEIKDKKLITDKGEEFDYRDFGAGLLLKIYNKLNNSKESSKGKVFFKKAEDEKDVDLAAKNYEKNLRESLNKQNKRIKEDIKRRIEDLEKANTWDNVGGKEKQLGIIKRVENELSQTNDIKESLIQDMVESYKSKYPYYSSSSTVDAGKVAFYLGVYSPEVLKARKEMIERLSMNESKQSSKAKIVRKQAKYEETVQGDEKVKDSAKSFGYDIKFAGHYGKWIYYYLIDEKGNIIRDDKEYQKVYDEMKKRIDDDIDIDNYAFAKGLIEEVDGKLMRVPTIVVSEGSLLINHKDRKQASTKKKADKECGIYEIKIEPATIKIQKGKEEYNFEVNVKGGTYSFYDGEEKEIAGGKLYGDIIRDVYKNPAGSFERAIGQGTPDKVVAKINGFDLQGNCKEQGNKLIMEVLSDDENLCYISNGYILVRVQKAILDLAGTKKQAEEDSTFIQKVNAYVTRIGFLKVEDENRAKKILKRLKLTKEDLTNKINKIKEEIQQVEQDLKQYEMPRVFWNASQVQLEKTLKKEKEKLKEILEMYEKQYKYFYTDTNIDVSEIFNKKATKKQAEKVLTLKEAIGKDESEFKNMEDIVDYMNHLPLNANKSSWAVEGFGGNSIDVENLSNGEKATIKLKKNFKSRYATRQNKLFKSATIKHENGVYNVYSESGKCLGKGYKTKEEAEKRLKQVEYFKHKSSLKQVVISKMAKIKK